MKPRVGTCTCGECEILEHAHRLNPVLVRALSSICRHAVNIGSRDVHVIGLPLTHSELCNFQKLQYWGFIQPVERAAGRRRGWWTATPLAFDFLEAKVKVRRVVWTRRNAFKEYDGDEILVGDVLEGYKWQPHYAGSRRPDDRAPVGVQLALA